MSRIFNALHQAELDQKTDAEAPRATRLRAQRPAKIAELPATLSPAVEIEEPRKAKPATADPVTAEDTKLLEVTAADVIVEELPQPPEVSAESPADAPSGVEEPVLTEWAVDEPPAKIPDSPVETASAIPELIPEPLEAIESIDLKTVDSTHLVAMADERGLGAEKFRVLAARLNNLRGGSKLKVLQVTSSVIGEGKTLVSANLAVTLAKRSSQSVLLLEGDLRKPALSSIFGLGKRPGLTDWWNGTDSIRKFLLRAGETNLYLLPSNAAQHPASVLQSGKLADALNELAMQFDWVIIDTPPLLPMADSNLWARLADGTLLVVRRGVVTHTALKQAMETMDSPKLVGVVMNDATDFSQVHYYDQYYSGKPLKKQAGRSEEGKSSE